MIDYFKSKIIKHKRTFVNYFIIGVIATVVDLSILYVLVHYFGLWYIYAATLSFIAGGTTNYILNKSKNFKNKYKKVYLQYIVFFIVAVINLLLNLGVMYILVEYIHINYLISRLLAAGIVMIWSYTAHYKITFGIMK